MTTQPRQEPRLTTIQTDDEKAEALRRANAEATASRLKMTFSEVRKTAATENPEAGCVAWYHFPQPGKQS